MRRLPAERERATYKELSQHLDGDVQRRDRYVLESARRKLEREGVAFVCETGVGLVSADDRQIAELSTGVPIEKIRRTTKLAKKREKLADVQCSCATRTAPHSTSAGQFSARSRRRPARCSPTG